MRMHQVVASIVTLALSASIAVAGGGTALTYQGRLLDAGEPANGLFDFEFSLWDAANGGNPIGDTQVLNNVPVADGLFTVQVDFGADAFDNADRWLEVTVNGDPLMPRQPITRAPYSIQTRGIFVDENNFVGIGTVSPSYPLHVEASTESPIYGLYTGNQGSKYGVYGRTDSSAATRGVFGFASNGNGFTIGVQGRSNSTSGTGVEGFAFASSGLNYGIRGVTNSPDGYAGYFIGRAHVSDTLFVGRENPVTSTEYFGFNAPVNSGYGGMYISTDGQGAWPFYGYAAGGNFDMWHYYDGTTGKWHLNNGGSNRLTVQSNGNVGIGTIAPEETLHVVSNGFSAIESHNTASSSVRNGVWGVSDSTSGRGVYGLATATSGVTIGVKGEAFSVSGFDFFAAGAGEDYGSSSSIRWKSNVRNIDHPLEKLSRLRGVYFNWDKEHGGHHDVGMIAEEVGEVLPEIVNYEENGIDAIGMDYSKLTPLLVEAINELHGEVQYKDSQITELQARLAALETLVDRLVVDRNRGAK